MNDPLASMRDIHLPGDVGLWPLAYGYWVVLFLVLVGLALWFRRYQRYVIHRAARAELDRLAADYQQHQNAHELAKAVNVLMRRTALSLKPREEAASLTGSEWMAYLHSCTMSSDDTFSSDTQKLLTAGIYQSKVSVDATALLEQCRAWIGDLPPHSFGARQEALQS